MNDPTLILPETCKVIEQGIQDHLHTGMQIYVTQAGKTVADFGYGEAKPGQPMSADSITLWLSSGKPISAVALALLEEKGKLDWNEPVIKFLPEFAGDGRDCITVRHLLTHTSGLKPMITGWPHAKWNEIIDSLSSMNLRENIMPGERAEYQPACTWFLIGEIIARISKMSFQQYLKQELFKPLEINNTWCGMTSNEFCENQNRIARMYSRRKKKLLPLEIHSELHCCAASPGGNFRGVARDLGCFYEMLLNEGKAGNGQHVLKPETVQELTSCHRSGLFDHTFQYEINMGLGFVLDSRTEPDEQVPYGYGKFSSKNCFGHGGAQSSIGFCDPDQQLVMIAISNGMAGEPKNQQRSLAIIESVYYDLSLV